MDLSADTWTVLFLFVAVVMIAGLLPWFTIALVDYVRRLIS